MGCFDLRKLDDCSDLSQYNFLPKVGVLLGIGESLRRKCPIFSNHDIAFTIEPQIDITVVRLRQSFLLITSIVSAEVVLINYS